MAGGGTWRHRNRFRACKNVWDVSVHREAICNNNNSPSQEDTLAYPAPVDKCTPYHPCSRGCCLYGRLPVPCKIHGATPPDKNRIAAAYG